jgi:hypothetical protein
VHSARTARRCLPLLSYRLLLLLLLFFLLLLLLLRLLPFLP